MSTSDIFWFIYVNNGNYVARPMPDIGDAVRIPIVLSENDYITGYDGTDNTFIDSVPPADQLIVFKVNRIDKTTLDAFTQDELDKIWSSQ